MDSVNHKCFLVSRELSFFGCTKFTQIKNLQQLIDKSTTMSKSAMEICLHLSLTLVFSIYLILFIQRYLHIISSYFSH